MYPVNHRTIWLICFLTCNHRGNLTELHNFSIYCCDCFDCFNCKIDFSLFILQGKKSFSFLFSLWAYLPFGPFFPSLPIHVSLPLFLHSSSLWIYLSGSMLCFMDPPLVFRSVQWGRSRFIRTQQCFVHWSVDWSNYWCWV